MTDHDSAVVIGVSAGGFDALTTVLPFLPKDYPLPIAIVQHRSPDSDGFLASHLDECSHLTVKEAEDKEPLSPGCVYLAPANYHLLIEADRTFALSVDPRVHYCRPAIDVLFESAADVYGEYLVGVILTGNNDDGSEGLRCIKRAGGTVVALAPGTAQADCMPRHAIEAAAVQTILPLGQIGPYLVQAGESMRKPTIQHC